MMRKRGELTCGGGNHAPHCLPALHQLLHRVQTTLPVLLDILHLKTEIRVPLTPGNQYLVLANWVTDLHDTSSYTIYLDFHFLE